MKFDFSGKTALVTGGSRGIGKQICNDLESLGANVISLSSKDFDLSSEDGLSQITDWIDTHCNEIDILVNNAGINFNEYIDVLDENKLDNLYRVNIKAPFLITKAVSKKMKIKENGKIINIASIAANRVRDGRTAYSTSKAFLENYVVKSANIFGKFDILINCLKTSIIAAKNNNWYKASIQKPEFVKEFSKKYISVERIGNGEDLTNFISLIISEKNKFMNGSIVRVDGGIK